MHGHNQTRTNTENDSTSDHQTKRIVFGSNACQQAADNDNQVDSKCTPNGTKDIDKDATKNGENGINNRNRRGNNTISSVVNMKVLFRIEKKMSRFN